MQKENRGLAGARELILRIEGMLAEIQVAIIAFEYGQRGGATKETLERSLIFLFHLKATNPHDIREPAAAELIRILQKKMEEGSFRGTVFALQKCIGKVTDEEPSEIELKNARTFLTDLQSTYMEKMLALAKPAYER